MARVELLPSLSAPGTTRTRTGDLAPSTVRPGQFSQSRQSLFVETAAMTAGLAGGLVTGVSLGFLIWQLV